jgi:hypothetical protein
MRAFAVSLVVVVACGVELGAPPDVDDDDHDGKSDDDHDDDDDHGSSGGGSPLTATKFLSRIGVQYCNECFRCQANYPAGTAAFAADFGATQQACYASLDDYYGPALVEQSITAGRIVFSATAAKTCLDGITYQQQCSVFWQNEPVFPQACDVTLIGKIADGGTCASIFDCATITSYCDDVTKRCTASP